MENCKYFNNCGSVENCKNCKGFEPVKIVYCIGGLWFDKVNGNTYNNVKVIDGDKIDFLGYAYGYGSDYYYRAKSHFDNIYGANNYKLVDLGSNYHKKVDVKRGNF